MFCRSHETAGDPSSGPHTSQSARRDSPPCAAAAWSAYRAPLPDYNQVADNTGATHTVVRRQIQRYYAAY